MKTTIKRIGILMVLSMFVLAPMVSSAELNSNLTGNVMIDLEDTLDASVDVNANTNTSSKTDSSVDSDIDLNTDIDVNLDSEMENEDEGLKFDTDTFLNLKLNSSGVAVISSSQVNSEADLEVFSSNVSAKDKEVAKVDINSNEDGKFEVKVVYRNKGKILGFIPTTVKSTTTVEARANAETEVHTKFPWWNFLVAKKNYVKADLESRIKNNTTIQTDAKVNASAQSKAKIAEAVILEISSYTDAQASFNK